jgi:hypothetical protein
MRRDIGTRRLKGFNAQPVVNTIVTAQVCGLRDLGTWPIVRWGL